MVGEELVVAELEHWGLNTTNFVADPNSCQRLYEVLVANYPCMNGQICTPVGGPAAFLSVFVLVILGTFFASKFYWKREEKK